MHCEYEKDALCARMKLWRKIGTVSAKKDALCARKVL